MTDPLDERLQAIFQAGLDDDGAILPDPSLLWWRALRQEKERRRRRATLPADACAALLEGGACIAPAVLLAFGISRGYFLLSPVLIAALAGAGLLAALWTKTRFALAGTARLLTWRGARPY